MNFNNNTINNNNNYNNFVLDYYKNILIIINIDC